MADDLMEQLAAIEHERWADWMRYFFSKCERDTVPLAGSDGLRKATGDLVVPAGYVAALEKLIATPYAELSEEQKENDRREVRRYWHLIEGKP